MSNKRRKKKQLLWIFSIFAYFLLINIVSAQESVLPSWNDTAARREIIQLIAKIEDTTGPGYLPPKNRVAVFDIDGTLWPERPTSIAGAFYVDRFDDHFQKIKVHFNFKRGDDRRLSKAHAARDNWAGEAETIDHYKDDVRHWLSTTTHPSLKMHYDKLVYIPMYQLIAFLKSKGFHVYLVTAAESDFMKAASEELFGVSPAQVIGTQMFSKLTENQGELAVSRTHIPRFINSRSNKVLAINEAIGKRPIVAFGNSEGDKEMLRWVASGGGSRSFLIKHDDRDREFEYDDEIFKGKDDAGGQRVEGGITVVSMKRDWKQVFQWQ